LNKTFQFGIYVNVEYACKIWLKNFQSLKIEATKVIPKVSSLDILHNNIYHNLLSTYNRTRHKYCHIFSS